MAKIIGATDIKAEMEAKEAQLVSEISVLHTEQGKLDYISDLKSSIDVALTKVAPKVVPSGQISMHTLLTHLKSRADIAPEELVAFKVASLQKEQADLVAADFIKE